MADARTRSRKPWRWLRRIAWGILGVVGLAVLGLAGCDGWVSATALGRVHDRLEDVQPAPMALLLGTSPRYAGRPNLFYQGRIRAAQELFASGKVAGILVSGDNRRADYNEPARMKADLVRAGVPAEFITMDLAGVRTLDSVVRARWVFGQRRIIVVSQRAHAERALFIARQFGLDAEAYAAPEPPLNWWIRGRIREVFARALACADVWVLDRQPRTIGPPEPVRLRPR